MQELTSALRSLGSTVSGLININPIINEACEDSNKPTPGYLYKDIAGTPALFGAIQSRSSSNSDFSDWAPFILLFSRFLKPSHTNRKLICEISCDICGRHDV